MTPSKIARRRIREIREIRGRRPASLILIVALGLAGGSAGQKAERLRVASNTVVVDVVATDKGNRHVMDLRKEELQVFEDEILQEVDSFAPVHKPTTEPRDLAATIPLVADGKAIHASREALGNLMVLLLDYATVEYVQQDRVRKAAVRYVRESMHPNDVLAVFRVGAAFRLLQNFTGDKEKLVAALQELDPTGSKFAWDQANLVRESQNAQNRVATLISNIETLRAGGPTGPAAAFAMAVMERQQDAVERMENRAYAELSVSKEMQARPVIAAIEAISAGLQPFPGRKTLILVSEGFAVPLALEKHLYNAVDRANKANVAIYGVDGAGLRHKEPNTEGELYDISALRPGDRARASMGISQFDRAREIGSDQSDSTLRYVSAATGGVLIRHTNDLFGALQRIDNDIRSYYILTYRPSNAVFDGAFRTIKVKSTRPGVTLRFRQGYFAVPPGASLIMPDEYATLVRARSRKAETDDKSLQVQPYSFLDEYSRFRVLLSIEFPAALAEAQNVQGVTILYPRLWGTVLDEDGEIVTSFRSPPKVNIGSAGSPAAGERSVSLQNELSLAPGKYSIEVYAEAREKPKSPYQTRSLNLTLPADGLSLSSIVLSNRSKLNGRTGALEHFPSAARQFQQTDKVIFYFFAYKPQVDSAGNADLQVRTSISNDTRTFIANLDPFQVTRVDSEGVSHAVISRFVELERLRPGRYQLETEVTDRMAGKAATARTTFTVLP